MKSDFFRRPTRFTHRFGETERLDDPLGGSTWNVPNFPVTRFTGLNGKREVKEYGESYYRPHPSPVQTPSGRMANINGPTVDRAQDVGMLYPLGTKWRLGPPDIGPERKPPNK